MGWTNGPRIATAASTGSRTFLEVPRAEEISRTRDFQELHPAGDVRRLYCHEMDLCHY